MVSLKIKILSCPVSYFDCIVLRNNMMNHNSYEIIFYFVLNNCNLYIVLKYFDNIQNKLYIVDIIAFRSKSCVS